MASRWTREYFMRRLGLSLHPQCEIVHLIDYSTIDREEAVGTDRALFVIHGDDRRLDRHLLARRHHLAAVDPAMRLRGDGGLELRAGTRSEAFGGGDLHELQQSLDAQRAGPDRVSLKVGLEEPLGGIDLLGA